MNAAPPAISPYPNAEQSDHTLDLSDYVPPPEVDGLTRGELESEIRDIEWKIEFAEQQGAKPLFITMLRHDLLRYRAALVRVVESENFTSDYRDPSSEVKFEREINLGDLQANALERGELVVNFLPVLGQEKFIVKGWSHLFAAYPKTGKTELLVRLLAEWSDERILYFTEEPSGAWDARMQKLPTVYGHVTLYQGLGAEKDEILARIQAGNETVVVLDTIRNLLNLHDETNNSEVARALIPYIAASRIKKQTLIAVHHDRKGGGEHGEGIAGGHAFLGAVDIAIELKRDGQEDSSRRLLRGWGRVFEIPRLIYELRDGVMVPLGSPGLVSLNEVKIRFLTVLNDEWQTTKDIIEAIGDPKPSNDQAVKALEELARNGQFERDPPIDQGKKQGKTYKWRRTENLTSDDPSYRSEVKLDAETSGGQRTWTSEL